MPRKRDLESSEAEIQKACLAFLEKAGFLAWRNHTQAILFKGRMMKNPNRGAADVFALKDGVFYAIEFKKPSGTVEDHQKEWLARASRYGARVMVIRSLDELIETLQRHGALQGFLFSKEYT